jgi:hypothetical protein
MMKRMRSFCLLFSSLLSVLLYCYGARISGRSLEAEPLPRAGGGDTARRRFIGGGRGPLLS